MTYTLTITGQSPTEMAALLNSLSANGATPSEPVKVLVSQQPAADSAPATEVEPVKISTEKVRELVTAKAAAGKKDEVKALLTKHGAASVTALDSSKYVAFVKDLEKL